MGTINNLVLLIQNTQYYRVYGPRTRVVSGTPLYYPTRVCPMQVGAEEQVQNHGERPFPRALTCITMPAHPFARARSPPPLRADA